MTQRLINHLKNERKFKLCKIVDNIVDKDYRQIELRDSREQSKIEPLIG